MQHYAKIMLQVYTQHRVHYKYS